MLYYISWSPKRGEATYTRCFDTDNERHEYFMRIRYDAKHIDLWERPRTFKPV